MRVPPWSLALACCVILSMAVFTASLGYLAYEVGQTKSRCAQPR